MLFIFLYDRGPEQQKQLMDSKSYSTISSFLDSVEMGKIIYVEIHPTKIIWKSKNEDWYEIYAPPALSNNLNFINKLHEKGIKVKIVAQKPTPFIYQTLITWGPAILIIIFIFWLTKRQAKNASNQIGSFSQSQAQEISPANKKITFEDVAGCEEAKKEVQEIIEFLKTPDKFRKLGARIPKGILLIGPPGCGKTLIAKAVAGEAKVPFFSESGSAFVEMFVGVGASRVRDLFKRAKEKNPCVVFIDELDAAGRHRGAGIGGGHDEREQTLNQILIEMDGFSTSETIIVLAATNRPDILDPALTRPGRFDRHIVISRPSLKDRIEILKIHAKNVPLATDVKIEEIGRGTPGFVGSDLANLINEAALIAGRRNKTSVEKIDFDDAKDRVQMGLVQHILMNDKEKRIVAYHESGHTLIAKSLLHSDPIAKVTIIPRGMALGVTQSLPEEDRHLYFKDYLLDEITILLGGRIAEQILGEGITNGAKNDIEKATELARKMVTEWGMSEKAGLIFYSESKDGIFLGRDIGQVKNYSEETAKLIDEEIKEIVEKSQESAVRILKQKKEILKKLAERLLEKETLEANEIDEIITVAKIDFSKLKESL
ncbi:MAG: ATP-dependent zinc metalloprotease FtsH [Candidatus Brennerbacteria bacterium]|nr:ATP-dependent zinc metalloprotease FtsH [Candidatus Brennerbacteria bacterium]